MTDKSNNVPIELIDRYLTGECTPAEVEVVRAWVNEDPERSALLIRLRSIDEVALFSGADRQDPAAAWERFREGRRSTTMVASPAEMDRRDASEKHGKTLGTSTATFRRPFQHSWRWAGIAACVTIGAILTVALPQWKSGPAPSRPSTGAEYTIYTTKAGERTTVSLRDGTKVILNVASRLEVPRGFGKTTRTVRVTGQALFDVTHAETIPFIVDAAGTRATVLGTRFSVSAYDANIRVAVESGRVSFVPCDIANDHDTCRKRQDQVILSANDLAAVNPSGQMRVSANAPIDREFAFSEGKLMLTGTSLRDAIESLERWYDVEIVLVDPALNRLSLQGAVPAGSAENLVQALEVILKVHVEQDGRVITVFPGRSAIPLLPRSK